MFDDNGGSDREEGCDEVNDGEANNGDAGDEEEYDDDG